MQDGCNRRLARGPLRRNFLRFLAGSPLAVAELVRLGISPQGLMAADPAELRDILSVMDFEAKAKVAIPPAHFGYLQSGVDDDKTLLANRAAYDRYYLRPRRMVDVTTLDASITLFGQRYDSPILLAPAGSQKAYHPEGESAVARAADASGHLQILSTVTSTPVEEVAKLHKRPMWFQLYPTDVWAYTERIVRRAEAAGCPVLAITVDTQAGRNTETEARSYKLDSRNCLTCHPAGKDGRKGRRPMPMFDGFQTADFQIHNPSQTWAAIARYRKLTRMKLVLKGLETGEDARMAVEHGVDGIVVSNHGARAVESGRGTLDCLPEVLEAVGGKIPVLLDGGIRRGTDAYKALALGATAVAIGRPYLWALGAFGEPGVAKVLQLLRNELALAMRHCGATRLAEISPKSLGRW